MPVTLTCAVTFARRESRVIARHNELLDHRGLAVAVNSARNANESLGSGHRCQLALVIGDTQSQSQRDLHPHMLIRQFTFTSALRAAM